MLPPELLVVLAGQVVGVVRRAAGDRLSFIYDDQWRDADRAYPLSLSIPLVEREHGDAPVRAYLEGLLPERAAVRESWGRRFGVSSRNAFSLLAYVGEDCPGAVQFVTPGRMPALETSAGPPSEWLTEADIAERLRTSIQMYSTGAIVKDTGYFSLPGAQPKIVLYRDGRRWAAPSAGLASTHVLKPPALDLDNLATNEHVCMVLADELGLPAARSEILHFERQVVIAVERFDRVRIGQRVRRIHQEDFCQAMGVGPERKYEHEGGPSAADCGRLLMEHAADPDLDLGTFVDALALNWVILGTDAHAKNYALRYADIRPSLAPLYDVISVLPYPNIGPAAKARLAMRVGGEYRALWVRRRHWNRLAEALQVDEESIVKRVAALVQDMPAAIERVRSRVSGSGIDERFADTLLSLIARQVAGRLRALEVPAASP